MRTRPPGERGVATRRRGCRSGSLRHHAIYPDRPADVLELLLADVLEGEVELARDILMNASRHADAARLGQAFEPGRDVDAIAKDVAVLDDDVADVDADAELDTTVRGQRGIAFAHRRLYLGRAAQRIDDAGELDQQPIAGRLDDASVMAGNFRIDDLGAQRL